MKKWMKGILTSIGLIFILFTIFYTSMAVYYRQHFSFGTTINGYYCAGLSVEEVNRRLLKDALHQTLLITHADGTEEISLQELSVSMDYTQKLQVCLDKQKTMLWGIGVIFPIRLKIVPDILLDEEKVKQKLGTYDFMKGHRYHKEAVTANGAEDAVWLNRDLAFRVILETLYQGKQEVSLVGNHCYRSRENTNQ